MDYGFIAYIFVAIAIILGVFSQLNNSGRTWSAIISLVLLILIFVFYGIRWFEGTSAKFSAPPGAWPPIINMCPDYLVYYKHSSGKDTCVDMLGVSSNASLTKWTDSDTASAPPLDSSNSYTSGGNAKYFKHIYKPGLNAAELKVLCDKAMEAGLKWEGITNGDACTYST
jgi:hypothetical protein